MSVPTPLEPARSLATPAGAAAPVKPQQARHASLLDRVDVAVASSCAPHHAVNEDAYSPIGASARLFVVADGVGSGAMAAVASDRLVSHLHQALGTGPVDEAAICQAVLDADRAIRATIAAQTDLPGAATAAWCARRHAGGSQWLVGWVGDCRVYQIRKKATLGAQLLTADDTYARLHEAPPPGGSVSDPARMIGNGAVTRPNVIPVQLERGETFVLCSDGAHRHLELADFEQRLRAPASLASSCAELVALARDRGSRDDATVLIVHRASGPSPLAAWLTLAVLAAVGAVLALLLVRGNRDPATLLGSEPIPVGPPTVRIER